MPPFLHLFCFVPKRNTTLTKTFATPKSFTKGLVLLSVYIIAYFSNSHNIDFATSTDSNGWTKLPISDNVVAYFKKGTTSRTMEGRTWNDWTASAKPADLNTSHTYFGGAGGVASDHAVNVSGYIDFSAGNVKIQNQNIYEGSVTAIVYWWAFIIEFLS